MLDKRVPGRLLGPPEDRGHVDTPVRGKQPAQLFSNPKGVNIINLNLNTSIQLIYTFGPFSQATVNQSDEEKTLLNLTTVK